MIKWNDVLEAAKKVMTTEEMRHLTVMESQGDPRQIKIVVDMLVKSEKDALDSVYKGDCDIAVFSHYKLVRDFGNLYLSYNDEKYAKGS